jgi:hypothetical protein
MTKTMRLITIGLAVFSISSTVWAQSEVDDGAQASQAPRAPQTSPDPGQQQPATHPVGTTYSNGYEVRLKIHKYASYATLPLFATEFALGQSLYNNPDTGATKGTHAAIGTGLVGLFAVNGVTGAWNLWEGRHDENDLMSRTPLFGKGNRPEHNIVSKRPSGNDPSKSDRREFLQAGGCFLLAFAGLPVFEVDSTGAATEKRFQIPAADSVNIDRQSQTILVRYQNVIYAFALACPHEHAGGEMASQGPAFPVFQA